MAAKLKLYKSAKP